MTRVRLTIGIALLVLKTLVARTMARKATGAHAARAQASNHDRVRLDTLRAARLLEIEWTAGSEAESRSCP